MRSNERKFLLLEKLAEQSDGQLTKMNDRVELCRAIGYSDGYVTKITRFLFELEEGGFIRRTRGPRKIKRDFYVITDTGREVVRRAHMIFGKSLPLLLESLQGYIYTQRLPLAILRLRLEFDSFLEEEGL